MSEFKNLSDKDVLRIERGIVYSVPARTEDGVVSVFGNYGDMGNQVRFRGGHLTGEFVEIAANRLNHWFCERIDKVLEGEEFLGSKEWKIVDGIPVAPPHPTPEAQ
jgi:hypothetical protein